MITIVHGGQTGVDRGAHKAAIDAGLPVAGYMPADAYDELGPIPEDVAKHLRAHLERGNRARTIANVCRSHALLCIVADKHKPYATPGTMLTLHTARKRDVRSLTFDAGTTTDDVFDWLVQSVDLGRHPSVMIAGPRASKWPQGELVAYSFVGELAGRLRVHANP